MAIGAYLNVQYPGLDPKIAAVGAYIVFMALNILGVASPPPSNWWSRCWRSPNCWCSWAWCTRLQLQQL
jgi:hypothetical protein